MEVIRTDNGTARRAARLAVLFGLCVLTVLAVTAVPALASTDASTFGFTGANQTFVVPSGVTTIALTLNGAAGGENFDQTDEWGNCPIAGGNGGRVEAVIQVTPGATLTLRVGGQGPEDHSGGWPNGGAGTFGDGNGGGGGSSSVLLGSAVLVEAGAGGGASHYFAPNGHAGPTPTGGAADGGWQGYGSGGNGVGATDDSGCGGGWNGGTDGNSEGGGGGSSYIASGVGQLFPGGADYGDGSIKIEWDVSHGSATFGFTGANQTFVVPSGVTTIALTLNGAAGGENFDQTDEWGNCPIAGGNGGRVEAVIQVTPGATLTLRVGGQGPEDHSGGWPNGGAGTFGDGNGGGGGSSSVLLGSAVLVEAGAGGGASHYFAPNGHAGPTPTGGAADGGWQGYGSGGNGVGATDDSGCGGGWNGGTDGNSEGGGGGSSYIASGVGQLFPGGADYGDGSIKIEW